MGFWINCSVQSAVRMLLWGPSLSNPEVNLHWRRNSVCVSRLRILTHSNNQSDYSISKRCMYTIPSYVFTQCPNSHSFLGGRFRRYPCSSRRRDDKLGRRSNHEALLYTNPPPYYSTYCNLRPCKSLEARE